VAAVIDGELATVGDSNADAVYHLMAWVMLPSESGGTGSLVGRDLGSQAPGRGRAIAAAPWRSDPATAHRQPSPRGAEGA